MNINSAALVCSGALNSFEAARQRTALLVVVCKRFAKDHGCCCEQQCQAQQWNSHGPLLCSEKGTELSVTEFIECNNKEFEK